MQGQECAVAVRDGFVLVETEERATLNFRDDVSAGARPSFDLARFCDMGQHKALKEQDDKDKHFWKEWRLNYWQMRDRSTNF